eukprot:5699112-Amphidinium_carterae.1
MATSQQRSGMHATVDSKLWQRQLTVPKEIQVYGQSFGNQTSIGNYVSFDEFGQKSRRSAPPNTEIAPCCHSWCSAMQTVTGENTHRND